MKDTKIFVSAALVGITSLSLNFTASPATAQWCEMSDGSLYWSTAQCLSQPRGENIGKISQPLDFTLTGRWQCDDGGTYYLRQIGNEVWWYGEYSGTNPAWSNVFKGTIQNNQISGSWADVPKGYVQSNGNMQIRVVSANRLEAIIKTGGFGGSVWTRLK